VAVDCGAIPKDLAESELLGYEKGAFTGADLQKEGKFEQANGGTLFLDEITNLSDGIQMKLLRVLQERKLQHLGGCKNITIDIRIIAATNTNFSEAVKAGKFRHDLFYRLNEFCILLPPLREIKEDIPILAGYYLDKANSELNKKIKGFSGKAMKSLLNYPWKGNARELKNVIKRAVLLTDAEYISIDNLDIAASEGMPDQKETLNPSASFKEKTHEFERMLIQRALERSGGNKIKAAEILQINRKALYRRMKDLHLG
jgi:transcriptional regulator with PAS, ATPase and Fis domain